MKGLNKEERLELYNHLVFNKKYTNRQLTTKALDLYSDRCSKVVSFHLGSDMVADGLLQRPRRNMYIKALTDVNPPNPPQNSQIAPALLQNPAPTSFLYKSPPATILHLATDKELADELRRRGYEVEAKKITTI